ncbi:putative RNA-binding protein 6 [Trypanosoma theileri]|uniref:Putative RNA-binding protein 6 n=1 Tax=Trypanosoma theileri TaxID=67003 RepID=A0A1X0P9U2_9TRYP|nr:putative RNA-binding protein 6 [Trypanosoma theileri]ORC93403.1 putative RNA-binding protein 6 [Trypanosoma theileri]
MYYSNGSQTTPHVGSFQGNQPYAVMPRHIQHHRQQFVDHTQQQPQPSSQPPPQPSIQQQQQQQRQVMQPQYTPNPQFMQMPMTSVNQNFVNNYPGVPGGYQSFGYSAPQRQQTVPIPSNDDRYRKQLIVNYLAPDVASAELHELFSRFGPLDGARIIYDRQTNLPKGYGFVYFAHPENAKEAVERMNGFEFHGKRLKVGYSTNPLNIVSSVHTQYTHGAIV